jgi:hypothetical protein
VQLQQPIDRLRGDRPAFALQDRRQPEGLARSLVRVDVGVAPPRIGDDEPDQPRPDDEPDDQQPPIELGVHRHRV